MKIIPAIDLMDGQVVRLYQGDPNKKTIYSSNPAEVAKKWQLQGADMLHIVDLDATFGRGSNFETIRKIASEVSIPIQIGGGLREKHLIQKALDISSRIVVGTIAFTNKEKFLEITDSLEKRHLVISVDHKSGIILIHGWQKSTDVQLLDGIKQFQSYGFTEFLVTSVSRDGTMHGPDLESLSQACNLKKTNIIASGGIANVDDVKRIKTCNAFGVILGKALYENKITIKEAKSV